MEAKKKDCCPNCGSEYKNLSMHWYNSNSCKYPKLSNKQKEIITGVLMGDGTIANSGGNPRIDIVMINKNYLKYINKKLGVYGKGVYLKESAKKSAKLNKNRGFRKNAQEEDYSDVYRLASRSSPVFNRFEKWYDTGSKKFPKDISLTPTILKNWFVCDGTYSTHGGCNRIEITATNEINRFDNIVSMFKDIGFDARTSGNTIYFSNSESQNVFNYMGNPLPGFERKWP